MRHPSSPQKRTTALLKRLGQVECSDTTWLPADGQFPIIMDRGRGMQIKDVDGRSYLDFTACFGVAALGHSTRTVRQALAAQARQLIHGMGDVHPTLPKIRLLELLAKLSPYDKAKSLLGLSGGDAIEAALKTAMIATGRSRFLSFADGYHGLQWGPLALNSQPFFRRGLEPWLEGKCVSLPFPFFPEDLPAAGPPLEFFYSTHAVCHPDRVLEGLEHELRTHHYAALVLEPIQGRGGCRPLPPWFLQACARLCRAYGTLLIFDEIFTGWGRTGTLFGWQESGVIPDLLAVGKAMGGGLPISACIGPADLMDKWGVSTGEARHTQTFLGHPLACAVACRQIRQIVKKLPLLQENLGPIDQEFTRFLALYKEQGLHHLAPVAIRGRGWMRGLWFYQQPAGFAVALMQDLLKEGYVCLPEGARADVLAFNPPLVVTPSQCRDFLRTVLRVLASNK